MTGRKSGWFAVVCAVLVALASVSACGGDSDKERGTPSSEVSTDRKVIDAGLEFGGIVVPPGAQVLGAKHASALDEYYDISLTTDEDGLRALLTESRFAAPLKQGFVIYPDVAAGPGLEESPHVTATDDRSRTPDGQPTGRHVRVDQRDPAKVYVHILVNTTP